MNKPIYSCRSITECVYVGKKKAAPPERCRPPPSVNEKRDNFELRDTWQTNLQTRVNRIKPSCLTLIDNRKEMYAYCYCYRRCD